MKSWGIDGFQAFYCIVVVFMHNKKDADRWLRQAEEDYKVLEILLEKQKHYMVCFLAQQAGEKAAKSIMHYYGVQLIAVHSVYTILKSLEDHLNIPEQMLAYAKRLDKYYIPTRYPDAFPDEIPSEMFDEEEAMEGARYSKSILEFARKIIG